MPYEINADKYAFAQTPQPEKINENYNAVLIRKLVQEEASKREALKSTLEQSLVNEVYARTDMDVELKGRIDSEIIARENAVSELSTRLCAEAEERALKNGEIAIRLAEEKEQRMAADASFLQAIDNLEADLSGEIALRQAADNELLQLKANATAVSALEKTVELINDIKENKVTIITVNEEDLGENKSFGWNGPDNHNTETRITASALELLYVECWDGEYPEDYCCALSFNSGDIPTTVSYPMGGIINWVGTDCVISEGVSVFQPSENTHYEIVMYYNGTQCIGMVNGFVPSNQEVG